MGLVHIYCGDGKGKTSASVGLAVRAAGRGFQVIIARFLKSDDSGEVEVLKTVPGITVLPCEKEFGFVFAMDEATKAEAAKYYRELFQKAVATVEETKADLLVMDEILASMYYNMVPEQEVLEFLKTRPENLEVVMTGRGPSEAIMEAADYITEMKMVRHPYEKGISARFGIEY